MDDRNSRIKQPGLRYLIVGGSVYLFELGIIVLAESLGSAAVMAVAISFIAGTIVSFLLQKIITFGDKRTHHKIVMRQIVATAALILFNFGFTILLTRILSDIVPAVVSRTFALALCTVWNFYLYKTHIFNAPNNTYTDTKLSTK